MAERISSPTTDIECIHLIPLKDVLKTRVCSNCSVQHFSSSSLSPLNIFLLEEVAERVHVFKNNLLYQSIKCILENFSAYIDLIYISLIWRHTKRVSLLRVLITLSKENMLNIINSRFL